MPNRKENPRLQPGTSESSWNSATHGYDGNTIAAASVSQLTASPDSESPLCLGGRYIPVARYHLDDETLSSSVICYDICGEPGRWPYVHHSRIPAQWLRGVPVTDRYDADLALDPLVIATLESLRGHGWMEAVRELVAWAVQHGYPQANFWGVVYDDVR
jgi:hypothetical protein